VYQKIKTPSEQRGDQSHNNLVAVSEVALTMVTMEDGTNNVPIDSDDGTASNTNSADNEDFSNPIFDHYAYDVLNARQPFPVLEKTKILASFNSFDYESFFHPTCMADGRISDTLKYICETSSTVIGRQGQQKLAELLVTLMMTFEKSIAVCAESGKRSSRASVEPPCIKKIKGVMKTCKEHLEAENAKATVAAVGGGKAKPLRLPKKTDAWGKTWQQNHGPFDPIEGARNPPCPFCRLHTTNAVVSTAEDNRRIIEAHKEALAVWAAAGGSKSNQKKPKQPKTKSDKMGCFASTQHCMLIPQGTGCYQCRALYTAGTPSMRQAHGNGWICGCLICQETCDAVYHRDQRKAIVDDIDAAKALAAGQDEPSKLLGVFAFTFGAPVSFGAGLVHALLLTLSFA
jgi:hypothetical protein